MSYISSLLQKYSLLCNEWGIIERFYFALFDDGLTLKTLKLAFIGFWIQTLHLYVLYYTFTLKGKFSSGTEF